MRSPPLNMTLPDGSAVADQAAIRAGLPPCLQTFQFLGKIDVCDDLGASVRSPVPYLHPFDRGVGGNVENALHPLIELEAQIVGIGLLPPFRQHQHLRLAVGLQIHHELQLALKLLAACARLHHQQLVTILARQCIGAHPEAVDADPANRIPARGHQRLKKRQILFEQRILVGQRFHLTRQIAVRSTLDLHLTLDRSQLAAKLQTLVAQVRHFLAEARLLCRGLAALEASQTAAKVIGDRSHDHQAPKAARSGPSAVPRRCGVDRTLRAPIPNRALSCLITVTQHCTISKPRGCAGRT